MSKNRNKPNNRTTSPVTQPEVTQPEMSPVTQPELAQDIIPELENASESADIDLSPDYKLMAIVHGLKFFDDKYKTQPAEVTVRYSLRNNEGARADSHVSLNVGSIFDRVTSAYVGYQSPDNKVGFMRAKLAYEGEDKFYLVHGKDSADNVREIAPLTTEVTEKITDESGNEVELTKIVNWHSKAKCTSERYTVRDLIARMVRLAIFKDTTPQAEKTRVLKAQLEKENTELKTQLETQAEQLARLEALVAQLTAKTE